MIILDLGFLASFLGIMLEAAYQDLIVPMWSYEGLCSFVGYIELGYAHSFSSSAFSTDLYGYHFV